jgi:hypothetical protein
MADLGTVTVTEETFSHVKKISFAWESEDGGGDAGKATKTTEESYTGQIARVVTIPDGTDAPSDNYDVQLLDEDGVDALLGAGADRDTANTEQIVALNSEPSVLWEGSGVLGAPLGVVANDQLTLSITSAGNAKKGVVHVYIR